MLNQLDIDGKDLRVLRNLYWDQTAAVRVGGELSEYTNIKRGVRQGCVMSPDLFNLYSEVGLEFVHHPLLLLLLLLLLLIIGNRVQQY
ncbi:hypothetical protein RRG08_031443 [Elysia crispata]|uniref:Reverse transcriptase domain-containing protein n=1 Tax=Elysia crispata TaxID=231223 RepID=A0AAE0ZPW2_9GAST|nr:hypothetical protein RRG08_031443 [Elysia crispata]